MVVVRDDERVVADPDAPDRGGEAIRSGEHRAGPIGVGELGVPAQMDGARDVPGSVLVVSVAGVERSQVPPAVDDPHGGILEVLRQPPGADEWSGRCVEHGWQYPSGVAPIATCAAVVGVDT